MEFNADGSLKVSKQSPNDHLIVFNLIEELEFPVGKKLLVDLLKGEVNSKILKHKLNEKIYYGSLFSHEKDQLSLFIDYLTNLNYLITKKEKGLYPVIQLTNLAKREIVERECSFKVDGIKDETICQKFPQTTITEQDRELFKQFDFFLNRFTEEQKKAITSMCEKQLCIAGAGSGKTTVLTNKIVFLVKFAGVNPEDILAITFTRKARQEMIHRLSNLLPEKQIRVETFNSFAEKEISYHALLLYGREKEMVSSKEMIRLVTTSLTELGYTAETFLEQYFTKREKVGKDQRQLFFSFLYDFSAILDSYIRDGKNLIEFQKKTKLAESADKLIANSIVELIEKVSKKLDEDSLRTYSDQLIDLIHLYSKHSHVKKTYSWVLVDEYQDVNSEQIELLKLIGTKNLFAVGDPRQSIFSWRGAEPERIYELAKENTEVVQLTKNFRSDEQIVTFTNKLIAELGFEECSANSIEPGSVTITKYPSDDAEAKSIVQEISTLQIPKREIFVLSRTNKGLEKVQEYCDKAGIKYILRTDEKKRLNVDPSDEQITLSTVHAIKGLEAKVVYVIGANYQNYPCKAKDHRFVELFSATKDYDQIQEEKRLLYVACTRAQHLLRITHTFSLSPFITTSMLKSINAKIVVKTEDSDITKQEKALKRWRFLEAKDRGIEPYNIFSDKVLAQILDKQPNTTEDLEEIQGFSKTKIHEFGSDIIYTLLKNS